MLGWRPYLDVGNRQMCLALWSGMRLPAASQEDEEFAAVKPPWRLGDLPGRDSWRKGIPKEDAAALKGKLEEYGFESLEQLVNWRLYNKTGGGLMAELGSHQLDAASIFLGKVHPLAVQGYGGKNFYGVKGVGSPDKQQIVRNPVMQYEEIVCASIVFGSPVSKTASRARFGFPGSGTTAP